MLNIESVNHVGIRVKEKLRSVVFYELLGFEFKSDAGFEQGHPIVMRHPSGVVLNLLGPSNTPGAENILMDVPEK
jgi:lactoylglutathione lyase